MRNSAVNSTLALRARPAVLGLLMASALSTTHCSGSDPDGGTAGRPAARPVAASSWGIRAFRGAEKTPISFSPIAASRPANGTASPVTSYG